jgi:hypothetical protein
MNPNSNLVILAPFIFLAKVLCTSHIGILFVATMQKSSLKKFYKKKTLDGTWLEKRGKKNPKKQTNEQPIVH